MWTDFHLPFGKLICSFFTRMDASSQPDPINHWAAIDERGPIQHNAVQRQ